MDDEKRARDVHQALHEIWKCMHESGSCGVILLVNTGKPDAEVLVATVHKSRAIDGPQIDAAMIEAMTLIAGKLGIDLDDLISEDEAFDPSMN